MVGSVASDLKRGSVLRCFICGTFVTVEPTSEPFDMQVTTSANTLVFVLYANHLVCHAPPLKWESLPHTQRAFRPSLKDRCF